MLTSGLKSRTAGARIRSVGPGFIFVAVMVFLVLVASSVDTAVLVERLSPGVAFLQFSNTADSETASGFFLYLDKALFLVTAEHVSKGLTPDSAITVATPEGKPFTFPLKNLVPASPRLEWATHEHADVAVLRLRPEDAFGREHLAGHFLPISWLEPAHKAPVRTMTLTILGFPLKLGVSRYFSPISRETKAASGLVELPRFDTKKPSVFFVTQDPIAGGFSGAPLFDTRLPFASESAALDFPSGAEPRIVGLVHGTIGDKTGAKFGAIVPSFLILEVLSTLTDK